MKRRSLAAILAVCLCLLCLPAQAMPTTNELSEDDLQSLENFLERIANSGMNTYDYKKATDNHPDQRFDNVFEALVTHPGVSYCDFSIYPVEQPEEHWDEADPLGKWDYGFAYCKYSVESIRWVLTNILNCSEQDFLTLEEAYGLHNDRIYKLDEYYYVLIAGIGTSPWIKINSINSVEDKYEVDYDFGAYVSEPIPYRAIVKLKDIDGVSYWSLYSNQLLPSTEIFPVIPEDTYSEEEANEGVHLSEAIQWAIVNSIVLSVSTDMLIQTAPIEVCAMPLHVGTAKGYLSLLRSMGIF